MRKAAPWIAGGVAALLVVLLIIDIVIVSKLRNEVSALHMLPFLHQALMNAHNEGRAAHRHVICDFHSHLQYLIGGPTPTA